MHIIHGLRALMLHALIMRVLWDGLVWRGPSASTSLIKSSIYTVKRCAHVT